MKSICPWLILILLWPWLCAGAERTPALEAPSSKPDLRPQLAADETEIYFHDWAHYSVRLARGSPASRMELEIAHDERAPLFDGVTKIILYSLYPSQSGVIGHSVKAGRDERLLALPRFHDYPVFGSVSIDEPDAVNRWKGFLEGEIRPAGGFMCDFVPRLGFRFSTPRGDIDILMCFHCTQIEIYGAPKVQSRLPRGKNAVFSRTVEGVINALFAKNRILGDLR